MLTICLQVLFTEMADTRRTRHWLQLLVMLQVHRTAVSNNVDEPCDTESSYTLYFTAPAMWANTTHFHTCLYKAAVDYASSPLVEPSTVVCPSLLWPQVRQVPSPVELLIPASLIGAAQPTPCPHS